MTAGAEFLVPTRGADDSPGLQLLGVVVVIGAVVLDVRIARRRSG